MTTIETAFFLRIKDWGPLVAVVPGIIGMLYALLADFFPPGGGETPMTEEHIEKLGMKVNLPSECVSLRPVDFRD